MQYQVVFRSEAHGFRGDGVLRRQARLRLYVLLLDFLQDQHVRSNSTTVDLCLSPATIDSVDGQSVHTIQ
jgi:hypothetical protein